MRKVDPETILQAVANTLSLHADRIRNCTQPKFEDHKLGYGRASLITQALCWRLSGLTTTEIAKTIPRHHSSITKAGNRIEQECRSDPKLRADIKAILKAL